MKFEEFEAAVPCLSPIFDAGVRTIAEQLTAASWMHLSIAPSEIGVRALGFGAGGSSERRV